MDVRRGADTGKQLEMQTPTKRPLLPRPALLTADVRQWRGKGREDEAHESEQGQLFHQLTERLGCGRERGAE